jgi:hypothetical protein
MEFIVWYMGEESRARELCETHGQGWAEVELSQFMGDFLFMPLFSTLIGNARPIGYGEILDKQLYSDPGLQDEAKLIAGTAEGHFVQRVNPEFVSRLAEIPLSKLRLWLTSGTPRQRCASSIKDGVSKRGSMRWRES